MLDTQANTVMQSLISLQKWFIYLEKVRESTEKLWIWRVRKWLATKYIHIKHQQLFYLPAIVWFERYTHAHTPTGKFYAQPQKIKYLCDWIEDQWQSFWYPQRNNQFSSVAQSCPTLCDPMNRSTPGLPVHHQLPEFTQTHVHRVSDAIQPSHPLSSPSPPAPNPSPHQSLFQWVNSSHEVAKVLEFQLQHQSFQWTPRTDVL